MKTILITGASSGIGKETAILFAQNGWNVAATMRNIQNADKAEALPNIEYSRMDVKDKNSIEECIQEVLERYGKIDVLVNNAGIYTTNPIELTQEETIGNVIDTNIKGVINVTKALIPHFRKRKAGTIVTVSSIAGRLTFPFQSVYHTSKWAIEGFMESLRYELKPFNINLKIIEPGVVKTNLYQSIQNLPLEKYLDDYKESFGKWYKSLTDGYTKGYNPAIDAKTIFRAVNSKSSKLRYRSDFSTKLAFFLRALLPLSTFQHMMQNMMSK